MPKFRLETTLDGEANVLPRLALLTAPHMAALEAFRENLERDGRSVPHFDPFDGGVEAELLILLETPGPSTSPVRFVSIDNPTGTAANLRRFLTAAGIVRTRIILWNIVPWLSPRRQRPTVPDIKAGVAQSLDLLENLPRLRAIVPAGRTANALTPFVLGRFPIFPIGHPSPTHVNTAPDIAAGMIATLAKAADI